MARHPSLLLGACLCLVLLSACADGDANEDLRDTSANPRPTPTAPPHDPEASPSLREPAGAYSILQLDLDGEYLTDIGGTYVLSAQTYSVSKAFVSPEEGHQLLTSWGYVDGYETGYIPEGRERAVLNGAFYFAVETHLFEDESGAQTAYEYIKTRLVESPVSQEVSSYPVGNASSAWEAPGDLVPGSSVGSVHHRIVFRRGNLLAMVATWGAENLMTIRRAHELALIVDQKALGERELVQPTPVSGQQPEVDNGNPAGD